MGHCSLCNHISTCNVPIEANIPIQSRTPKHLSDNFDSNKLNILMSQDLSDDKNKLSSVFIDNTALHNTITSSSPNPFINNNTINSNHSKHKHYNRNTIIHRNTKHIKSRGSKMKLFMKLSTIKHSINNVTRKIDRLPTTEQILINNKKTLSQNLSLIHTRTIDSNSDFPIINHNRFNHSIIHYNSNSIKNNHIKQLLSSFDTHDYMKLYTTYNKTKQIDNVIEEQEQQEQEQQSVFGVETIEITNEQEKKVLTMLQHHYLFKHFDEKMLQIIIDNSQGYQIDEGTIIYNEGEIGESFFIIQEGQVQITSNSDPKSKKVLSTGDAFGDIALIYNETKRNETAIALTNLAFYVIFGSSYRETSKNYSKHSIEQITYFINNNIWLCNLDQVVKFNLASLAINEEYTKNQLLYSKNNESNNNDKIFLVKSGALVIMYTSLGNKTKQIFPRDSFGESQVILNIDTNETYELLSSDNDNSSSYVITKQNLIEAIGVNYKETILLCIFNHSVIKNTFFKTILLECYFSSIYSLFHIETYTQQGSIVYKTNSDANDNIKAVLLLKGNLIDEHNKTSLVSQGELYGDEIINSNQHITNNIITSNDDDIVITLECSWINIRNKLKELSKNSSLDVFKRANKLTKMQMFKHLNESRILELCQLMKKAKFSKGSIIINEGSDVVTLYVIYKGRVRIQKKGILVREVEEGNCFGEINVLSEDKSDYTVIADTNLQCYTLSKETFMKFLIDEKLNEYIKNKMCLEDTNIDVNDLYYIKQLGKGRFGTVSLVHNQISLYAIKTIPRIYIDSSKQLAKYLLVEKNILLSLDFPLIVKLVKTLKTDRLCFLLMEYINGVSLEEHESNKIRKNVTIVKFLAACIIITLDYLNKKSIAHRDIKPANIILDNNTGYFKLLDFGTAKYVRDFTFTVIGTPTCMAPELILGKGYSFPVDYWSLGISLYFMYYGKYPFGHNSNDIVDIYNQIIHQELTFPFETNDTDLRMFLGNLLNKTPIFRLCSFEKIRDTSLFKGFNWNELKELKLKSPCHELNNTIINGNSINISNSNIHNKNSYKDINNNAKNTNLLKNIRQTFLSYIMSYKFEIYHPIQNNELYQNEKEIKNWFDEF